MIDTKQYHVSNDSIMEGMPDNIIIKQDGDLYKAYDLEAISGAGRVVAIWGCSYSKLAKCVQKTKRVVGTHANNNYNSNLNN